MSAAWTTVKVFISSTFKDMQAERDHLVRFVFPKLREELLKHRIHFVDVDLRWGVTSDQDATGVCRQVIDECRPRFMCILGGRYGWVPEKKDKSITADEVHYGVLDRETAERGQAFFYFRSDEDTLAIPDEDARCAGYREFALLEDIKRFGLERAEALARERTDKLAALKQAIIDAKLPVHHYEAKWSEVEKRLTGLEKFGERIYDDLLHSLQTDPDLAAHFTTDTSMKLEELEFYEEAAQMDAFIEERTERYVTGSRDSVLQQMQDFAAGSGTPSIFVLTGDPGSGKSALLAHFCRNTGVPPEAPPAAGGTPATHTAATAVLLPHFIGASTGSTDLRRTLRRLCHELAKASVAGGNDPGTSSALPPLDLKELIPYFQQRLADAAATRRIILILDALNQFDATDGAHWLNWLPRELPPGVRIVASVIAPAKGEKEHQTLAILSNRKDTQVTPLAALEWKDTVRIMRGYLKRYSKRMSNSQKRALLKKPDSHLPLYILTALEELRTLGTDEQLIALASQPLFPPDELERLRKEDHDAILTQFVSEELPGTAVELFKWILKTRLSKDPILSSHPNGAPALVEKFGACLGVSRHGLSPAELTALLSDGGALAPASAASPDPLGNVAALLRLLRPYLMRRGELLDFYHGQFREAALAAHLDTPEKQRAAHQSVATCLQAFADPRRDGQCRDATPHALSELPHHQTHAEAWPDLIATLENIFFLEAKVTHGMAFDLVEDFAAAVDALPMEHVERQRLHILNEALRRDIHFIEHHAQDYPQALFQSLWNSCWWYDCSDATQHYEGNMVTKSPTPVALCVLLGRWHLERQQLLPNFHWLRSLRPPQSSLGGPQLAVFADHDEPVTSARYSPDGKWIATASGTEVKLWDAASGALISILRGHEWDVCCFEFSPNGTQLASGSKDNTLRIWDLRSGLQVSVLTLQTAFAKRGVIDACFSPLGDIIACASNDGLVRVWDLMGGSEPQILRYDVSLCCVAFSPDGARIVTGALNNKMCIWDVVTFAQLAEIGQSAEPLEWCFMRAVYTRNGKRIVGACARGSVRILDAKTGKELKTIQTNPLSSVDCSSDSTRLVIGSSDGKIRVFDIESGAELRVLPGHALCVNSVAFSPDGARILSASRDKTAREFVASGNALSPNLKGHGAAVPGSVTIKTINEALHHTLTNLKKMSSVINAVCCSSDGLRIASCGIDGIIRIWSAATGVELAVMRGHEGWVQGIAFSPDGGEIASGSADRTVRIWDANTGKQRAILAGHQAGVTCVDYSPDGGQIAAGSDDGILRVFAQDRGTEVSVMRGHEHGLTCVAFSPDGQFVASGSVDCSVRIWEATSGCQIAILRGHRQSVSHVKYVESGSVIVSVSLDHTIRVWSAEDYASKASVPGEMDAGPQVLGLPFNLVRVNSESVLVKGADRSSCAWLPIQLHPLTVTPDGGTWSGGYGDYIAIYRHEGVGSAWLPPFILESSDDSPAIRPPKALSPVASFGDVIAGERCDISEPQQTPVLQSPRAVADTRFAKGEWAEAAADFESLLYQGLVYLEDVAPKLATCLVNLDPEISSETQKHLESMIAKLDDGGWFAESKTIRQLLKAKTARKSKLWWFFGRK